MLDADGKLFLHTNGQKVWNSKHTEMANGYGLEGYETYTQSSITPNQDGFTNIFFGEELQKN